MRTHTTIRALAAALLTVSAFALAACGEDGGGGGGAESPASRE